MNVVGWLLIAHEFQGLEGFYIPTELAKSCQAIYYRQDEELYVTELGQTSSTSLQPFYVNSSLGALTINDTHARRCEMAA